MYLIKWKDYEEQTWEPEENVVNADTSRPIAYVCRYVTIGIHKL